MDVQESREGATAFLEVVGRLDSNSADAFSGRITACLDGKPTALVIGCASLEYMSSAGLRGLLMAAKRCRAEGIALALHSLRSNVLEIFEMSGLLKVFPIYADREAATAVAP